MQTIFSLFEYDYIWFINHFLLFDLLIFKRRLIVKVIEFVENIKIIVIKSLVFYSTQINIR
jgi:hypothetical protein